MVRCDATTLLGARFLCEPGAAGGSLLPPPPVGRVLRGLGMAEGERGNLGARTPRALIRGR